MQRFLGLSKEELQKTNVYGEKKMTKTSNVGDTDAAAQLRDAGITGADMAQRLRCYSR